MYLPEALWIACGNPGGDPVGSLRGLCGWFEDLPLKNCASDSVRRLANRRSVEGFGFSASFSATRIDLLETALSGLPSGFRTLSRRLSGPCFAIQASRGVIELTEGQQVVYSGRSKRGLRLAAEAHLEMRASTESDRLAFLHAGGVVIAGRAILFPGRSQAGKSMLVRALVRKGAAYLSDDMIPIDARIRAHPFPRPFGLRPPNGGAPVKTSLKSLNVTVRSRPAPIGLIWCGVYDPLTVAPSFRRRLGREAFAELLPHAPAARMRPEVILPILTQLAERVPVFTGVRGPAEEMADALFAFMERARRVR